MDCDRLNSFAEVGTLNRERKEYVSSITDLEKLLNTLVDVLEKDSVTIWKKASKFDVNTGEPVEWVLDDVEKWNGRVYTHKGFSGEIEVHPSLRNEMEKIASSSPVMLPGGYVSIPVVASYNRESVLAGWKITKAIDWHTLIV